MDTHDDAVKSIMAIVERAMAERLQRSFCLASRDERKGRLRAVMALSAELERLQAESIFATGLAEGVIADIIEGEWGSAHNLGMHFTFETEGEHLRTEQAPRWAKFVGIVRVECALAEKRARSGKDGQLD